MKELLAQTIRLLCKNGLNFISELSVEALIGITVDQTDVFLINIKETVQTEALLPTNLDSVETGGQEARPNLNSSLGSESVVNEESNAEQQSVRHCHSASRSDILFDSSSESSEAAKKLRLIKSESASVAISDIQTEQFISDKECDKIMRAPADPYSAVKTMQRIRKPFFKTRSRKRSLSRQLLYNFESSDNYQLTPEINLNSHHATELSKYSRNIVENSVGTRETMSERCINGTGDQLDSKTNTSNDERFQVKSEVLSNYTDSSYADNTVYLEDPVSPYGADGNVLSYTEWNLGHSGPGGMRSGSHQSTSWNMNDADTEVIIIDIPLEFKAVIVLPTITHNYGNYLYGNYVGNAPVSKVIT